MNSYAGIAINGAARRFSSHLGSYYLTRVRQALLSRIDASESVPDAVLTKDITKADATSRSLCPVGVSTPGVSASMTVTQALDNQS